VTSVTDFHSVLRNKILRVEIKTKVFARYDLELALIEALDRAYYSKSAPTSAERAIITNDRKNWQNSALNSIQNLTG